MSLRRTLTLSILAGIALTVAVSWGLATRALDTPSAGRVANNGTPSSWLDVARYDRFGSLDIRCLAADTPFGDAAYTPLKPEDLTPLWTRPWLVPWGWNQKPPPGAFSVRTVKISGWPLPCLYSVYEAVPSPGMWPHRAISGIVISDTWTGFGPKYGGEMPVAFPYRPRIVPLALNAAFYALLVFGVLYLAGAVRRSRRRNRGRCTACNYDLRGLASGSPCPECGLPRLGSRICSAS